MRRTVTLGLILLSMMLLACAVSSAATVKSGLWNGRKSIILENRYLKVTVLPDANGRIAEYIYKPSSQSLFLPYAEKGGDVPLLTLVGIAEHNSGGWDELFVETGLQMNKINYAYKVERSARRASVILTRPAGAGGVGLVRTMTLDDDSLALRIDIKVKSGEQGTASLWAHGLTLPCGDFDFDDYSIIPACKNTVQSPVITVHSTKLVPADSLLIRPSKNGTSCMYQLGQPWFAVKDAKRDFAFGHIIRPSAVTAERTVFSCWSGKLWGAPAMTQELFLPTVKAKEERTFSLYIAALPGMKGVSWLGTDAAVYTTGLYKGEGKVASVTILALKKITNATLTISNTAGWKQDIPIKKLAPGERVAKRITLPANAAGQNESFLGKWSFGGSTEEFVFFKPQRIDE